MLINIDDFEKEVDTKGKYFLKNIYIDIPFNVFKEKPELEFILACIPMITSGYKNRYVSCDDQGNVTGVCWCDSDDVAIDLNIPSWGMELKSNKNSVCTSLFHRRIIHEKYKDTIDGALIDMVIGTLTMVKKNLDRCINALECPVSKSDVLKEKDFILNFIDEAIKNLKENKV